MAIDNAKECIRLDPTFVKGYYRLAAAQMELKDHDGAIATIRQGLSIDPNNVQLSKQMRIVQQLKKVTLAKSQAPPLQTGQLDPATAKEFQELQMQYALTSREFNTVQANLVKTQRECKVAEITCQELQDVPATANCYRSIGKMFLRSSKQGVVDHLMNTMETQHKNETDMTKKMEYLERQMASLRQNLEELVSPGASSSAE
jgi:chaperonin cofactor prefoldin